MLVNEKAQPQTDYMINDCTAAKRTNRDRVKLHYSKVK